MWTGSAMYSVIRLVDVVDEDRDALAAELRRGAKPFDADHVIVEPTLPGCATAATSWCICGSTT